jgi:hypothetical protein
MDAYPSSNPGGYASCNAQNGSVSRVLALILYAACSAGTVNGYEKQDVTWSFIA